jgi:hypothetical protein
LHSSHVIHADRRIRDEKNQIHKDNISQSCKARYYRHAYTHSAFDIQFLKRHNNEEDSERDVVPMPEGNVLPSKNTNELWPKVVTSHRDSVPCCQWKVKGMLPHVTELPKGIELFARNVL